MPCHVSCSRLVSPPSWKKAACQIICMKFLSFFFFFSSLRCGVHTTDWWLIDHRSQIILETILSHSLSMDWLIYDTVPYINTYINHGRSVWSEWAWITYRSPSYLPFPFLVLDCSKISTEEFSSSVDYGNYYLWILRLLRWLLRWLWLWLPSRLVFRLASPRSIMRRWLVGVDRFVYLPLNININQRLSPKNAHDILSADTVLIHTRYGSQHQTFNYYYYSYY